MTRKIDWENQIGRRLKLRDLHVFFTVVQRGSMAKAAAQLGVSQPAVSEVISDLEHALGVRLLDRSSRGVEPTMYGRALLKRGTVAFDELKQSIRDIEFLADPSSGEVQLGCAEATASGLLPPFLIQFLKQYPRVTPHVKPLSTPTLELSSLARPQPRLRSRTASGGPPEGEHDDLNIEMLFDDELAIAAGTAQPLGGETQDRARRAGQRALGDDAAQYLEHPDPGGDVPRPGPRDAEALPDQLLGASARQHAGARPVHCAVPTVDRAHQRERVFPQGPARSSCRRWRGRCRS